MHKLEYCVVLFSIVALRVIYFIEPMYSHFKVLFFKDSDILFELQHVTECFLFCVFIYLTIICSCCHVDFSHFLFL